MNDSPLLSRLDFDKCYCFQPEEVQESLYPRTAAKDTHYCHYIVEGFKKSSVAGLREHGCCNNFMPNQKERNCDSPSCPGRRLRKPSRTIATTARLLCQAPLALRLKALQTRSKDKLITPQATDYHSRTS